MEIQYNIYYNNQFNNIVIIDDYKDKMNIQEIKKIFPELELINKCQLNDNMILILTNEIYIDFNDAKNKVNNLLNNNIEKISINEIKQLINKYFDISSDSNDIIKFTNIFNKISCDIIINDKLSNYIKKQLPNVLLDLGLEKKRYSDGIYWYGLIPKKDIIVKLNNNLIIDTPITDEEIKFNIDNYKSFTIN